jgi:hypothetical protein
MLPKRSFLRKYVSLALCLYLYFCCIYVFVYSDQASGRGGGRWRPGTTATVRVRQQGGTVVVLQGHLQEVYGRRVRFSFIQLEQLFEITS